jgi:hypothetical protein
MRLLREKSHRQAASPSAPKAYREAEKALFTPTKRPMVIPEYRRDSQSDPASTSTTGPASTTTGPTSREGGRKQDPIGSTNEKKASQPAITSSYNASQQRRARDALSRLLEQDADLGDWLIMTNYHDVELRDRKLERQRNVIALAAQKEKSKLNSGS